MESGIAGKRYRGIMENKLYLCIALFSVVIAFLVVLWNDVRTKKTMDRIEKMLTDATKGEFSEENFDESRLSALETKFAHFFSASMVSAQNVAIEQKKIKTLISDISHQTKTPISNILLYSELLEEEDLSETAKENVLALHEQTDKLKFLIDALVKLSRLENGIVKLSVKQEKIEPMIEKVIQEQDAKAKEKGLQLRFSYLKGAEQEACFDKKWTAEAIGNLVDNAIKYTKQGSITITVTSYEMFVRIDIKDTGVGIKEEELPKIFSRFYRSETVRENEGVGIGLYLAREIIAGEGGYIKVSSEYKKGSTFSVFLSKK